MRLQSSWVKRKLTSPKDRHAFFGRRLLVAASLLILAPSAVHAIPVNEYHAQIQRAVTAIDSLAQSDESEDASAYKARTDETLSGLRTLLPREQLVEWNGASFNVDNSWLHQELDKYGTAPDADRADLLKRIAERLKAIEERIAEIEKPGSANIRNKAEESRKLTEILRRPEYVRQVKQQSAFSRLIERFLKWLQSLMPKPKPFSPGNAGLVSQIAQVFVIILALTVLAFVLKLFLPRLLKSRGSKKKAKPQARIVLGEKLEPDQSALDLLSEAELLARRGELRTAIRKAYIALLVELGDRKIISLAQYKTNRDYLRAVREVEPLYGNVKQLTDSFERHWYGLTQATESDWTAFRSAYEHALRR